MFGTGILFLETISKLALAAQCSWSATTWDRVSRMTGSFESGAARCPCRIRAPEFVDGQFVSYKNMKTLVESSEVVKVVFSQKPKHTIVASRYGGGGSNCGLDDGELRCCCWFGEPGECSAGASAVP